MSKYQEVLHIKDKTAHTIVGKLKVVFTKHGILKELVSDDVLFSWYETFFRILGVKQNSFGYSQTALYTVKHPQLIR